ncbi:MAG: malto-oligosyltrehalose trehalohydrolase [Deltaproteobacteria bacterium]|nr:malto-oligosyltrehalose trehalohydrolase [Deltaproteobacteria bacterium]
MWQLEFGAKVLPNGGVCFRVWAPFAKQIDLKLLRSSGPQIFAMGSSREREGVFEAVVDDAAPNDDYFFVVDGAHDRPDPVTRWQPHGVHGASRVVDPAAFAWTDGAWKGRALKDLVLYELHVGTFTPEGTFDAAIEKLPHLLSLGITAVELMPVAQCPGARNWGYDGVALYAPQHSFGGPDGLKRLVDACHAAGLAVVLDVVYNHLGPEGNYLGVYGPYFTDRYKTPWGDALNFDGAGSDDVRRFFIDNTLYWITEYHFDGLRLDAVHGIFDMSATHILEELTAKAHAQAAALGRTTAIIAESDLNDPRIIESVERGGYGVDSQWSDDFHHAVHTALTETERGYFADFGRVADVGKSIAKSFVYDGRYSRFRGRRHGRPAAHLPGERFVGYIQNHDQVANGSAGDRLSCLVTYAQQKLAAALLFAAPQLPMLFMGQEWGEVAPFYYFTDHGDPDLGEAVRIGRAREFASFGREFPNPQSEESFIQSKLNWQRLTEPGHAKILRFYTDLLALRARFVCLRNGRKDLTHVDFDEEQGWIRLLRRDPEGPAILGFFNLRPTDTEVPFDASPLPSMPNARWRLVLASNDALYGDASGTPAPEIAGASGPKRIALTGSSAVFYSEDLSSMPDARDERPIRSRLA